MLTNKRQRRIAWMCNFYIMIQIYGNDNAWVLCRAVLCIDFRIQEFGLSRFCAFLYPIFVHCVHCLKHKTIRFKEDRFLRASDKESNGCLCVQLSEVNLCWLATKRTQIESTQIYYVIQCCVVVAIYSMQSIW